MLLSRSRRATAPRPVRTPQANPWTPSVATLPRPPAVDRGRILAIIPTAGRDLARLRRCLAALRRAARGEELRIVVVACPSEHASPGVDRLSGVELVQLPGPFNYPRSINAGLDRARDADFVLLLNDDCELEAGALGRLRATLAAERWACVGPRLAGEGYPTAPEGPARRETPVPGACVLWDREWLARIGPFDEQFGKGYGFDESDQSLRALRLGATWGVDGRVTGRHARHGTFGPDVPRGPLWFANRDRWRKKYPGVDYWGQGTPWQPLPAVQVVMAGHNVAPWLERALRSVAHSLAGFRWGLAFAEDGSTDATWEIAAALAPALGADWMELRRYPKARTVGAAKNRAHQLAAPYRRTYPAVLHMDADDVMRRERASELLWRARDRGLPWAHGAWLACGDTPHRGEVRLATTAHQQSGGMSACASVLHASLLPPDGLSDETLPAYEDSEWMLRFWLRGLVSVPLPEAGIVHEYWHRAGSVQTSGDRAAHRRLWLAHRAQLLARG